MAQLFSVIPGGATQTEMRGLILGPQQIEPRVTQEHLPTGKRRILQPHRAERSHELGSALAQRAVDVYRFHARDLSPGESYRFFVDAGPHRQHALRVQTLPRRLPEEGLTITFGSCYYDGFHKDRCLRTAFEQKHFGRQPALHFATGDNIYLDVPFFGGADDPYAQTLDRYLQYFAQSRHWQARATLPSFTTYDDHELWNNYPESNLWLERDDDHVRERYARAALECLDLFQASLNPSGSAHGCKGRSFRVDLEDVSFFVADVRSNRQRHDGGRGHMLHPSDLQALRQWTNELDRPGVLVVRIGQPTGSCSTSSSPHHGSSSPMGVWRASASRRNDHRHRTRTRRS